MIGFEGDILMICWGWWLKREGEGDLHNKRTVIRAVKKIDNRNHPCNWFRQWKNLKKTRNNSIKIIADWLTCVEKERFGIL